MYFLGDVACFPCFRIFASDPTGLRATVRATLLAAAINLVFALIDVGGWLLHAGDLLSFIRNGSYRMLDEATVGGLKRIVGSFPEASTFAYFTLGWFAFCTRLWLAGIYARVSGPLALLSLGALLFSTSSTGYVGVAVFPAALLAVSTVQVLTRPVARQTLAFALIAPAAVCVLLIGLRLHQPSWDAIERMVDATVVKKLDSDSGVERGRWNEQALVNFSDTNWLAAGVGSVRASSFPVAVLGNIGAIGAVTYGAFVFAVLFRHSNRWAEPYSVACQSAARWACFAQVAGASAAGSFIDLGLPFFVFAGLASAAPAVRRVAYPSPGHPQRPLTGAAT